jgi:hypothetical protein
MELHIFYLAYSLHIYCINKHKWIQTSIYKIMSMTMSMIIS